MLLVHHPAALGQFEQEGAVGPRLPHETAGAGDRVGVSGDLAEGEDETAPGVPRLPRRRPRALRNGRLVDGRITVSASEHRTQLANRRAARERLTEMLSEAASPPPAQRRATRPTRGSRERRLRAKRSRSELKRGRGPITE